METQVTEPHFNIRGLHLSSKAIELQLNIWMLGLVIRTTSIEQTTKTSFM